MSAQAQPLPLCLCGHTINFENTRWFLHQKVLTSTSEEPPLSALENTPPPDCRRLVWTAPKQFFHKFIRLNIFCYWWNKFLALTYQSTSSAPKIIQLPTAPRAARTVEIDHSRIPENGPFTAFVGNLPYEVDQYVLQDFFKDLTVSSIELYSWCDFNKMLRCLRTHLYGL